jgi:hypothetical protein
MKRAGQAVLNRRQTGKYKKYKKRNEKKLRGVDSFEKLCVRTT